MNKDIEKLLKDLKSPKEHIREEATSSLWQMWFEQKGMMGLEYLRESQSLLESGRIKQAEQLLNEVIYVEPDFVEAWNRRAVLYYTIGEYEKALKDCQKVVELNPIHFGAWHGLGLCYAALERYSEAIRAFHKALEIQPYAIINQRLILECTTRLN
jgi:tetratricopeptide (TPR) repeat protein